MIALGLIVAGVLLAGCLGLLYYDGIFSEGKDWLQDDQVSDLFGPFVYQPPSFQTPAKKGVQARTAKVVPMRPSQLPRRATK